MARRLEATEVDLLDLRGDELRRLDLLEAAREHLGVDAGIETGGQLWHRQRGEGSVEGERRRARARRGRRTETECFLSNDLRGADEESWLMNRRASE